MRLGDKETMRLRFKVDDTVICNINERWQAGTITSVWVTDRHFPRGMVVPYCISLATRSDGGGDAGGDGPAVYAPVDDDRAVKANPRRGFERASEAEHHPLEATLDAFAAAAIARGQLSEAQYDRITDQLAVCAPQKWAAALEYIVEVLVVSASCGDVRVGDCGAIGHVYPGVPPPARSRAELATRHDLRGFDAFSSCRAMLDVYEDLRPAPPTEAPSAPASDAPLGGSRAHEAWELVWSHIEPWRRWGVFRRVARDWARGVREDPAAWRFIVLGASKPAVAALSASASRLPGTDWPPDMGGPIGTKSASLREYEWRFGERVAALGVMARCVAEGAIPLTASELRRIPDLAWVQTLVVADDVDNLTLADLRRLCGTRLPGLQALHFDLRELSLEANTMRSVPPCEVAAEKWHVLGEWLSASSALPRTLRVLNVLEDEHTSLMSTCHWHRHFTGLRALASGAFTHLQPRLGALQQLEALSMRVGVRGCRPRASEPFPFNFPSTACTSASGNVVAGT
jgi:hypothetical protein